MKEEHRTVRVPPDPSGRASLPPVRGGKLDLGCGSRMFGEIHVRGRSEKERYQEGAEVVGIYYFRHIHGNDIEIADPLISWSIIGQRLRRWREVTPPPSLHSFHLVT